MSGRRDSLSPPKRPGMEDTGAHELDTSDSDDHFSDAQSAPAESARTSPIPKTRVEKVDDEPSYGEVPGTEAYRLREGDAEPDEIAVVPEASAKATSSESESEDEPRPTTPVPKTVVELSPNADGSVSLPENESKHRADPPPDLVLEPESTESEGSDGKGAASDATPISPALKTPNSARPRRKSSSAMQKSAPSPLSPRQRGADDDDDEDGGDFGDDFDDFEEGDEDADFGDFDDGFQEPDAQPAASTVPAPAPRAPPISFPIPDFDGLDSDEIIAAAEPYLNALFPPTEPDHPVPPPLPKDNSIFLTPRSASLWSQLVAPPPLQPPDWIRSRIRRLFLVSLGVPVDLDEILPASKQKKLVLPSLKPAGSSRASSVDGRGSLSRIRREGTNVSSTSVDSQGRSRPSRKGAGAGDAAGGSSSRAGSPSKSRKASPGSPEFDLVAAKQVCMTTGEALDGMTDAELKNHVARVEAMEGTANEVLEYWRRKADEKIGDREAFEGVIENLVKHARKVRK